MARGRRHSEEFKADAVALVRKSGRPVAQVAKSSGSTIRPSAIGCATRMPSSRTLRRPNSKKSAGCASA